LIPPSIRTVVTGMRARLPVDLGSCMPEVARRLLGLPNKALSNIVTLRYGRRGSFVVDLKKGVWFDHEVGEGGGVMDLIEREIGLTGLEAMAWLAGDDLGDQLRRSRADRPMGTERWKDIDRSKAEADARFIRTTLAGAKPIKGTIVEAYLAWRRCPLPPAGDALLFHPGVQHPSGVIVPAMVARITDARDDSRLLGLHLTVMTETGKGKSELEPRKWMRGRKSGGVVRLCPDEDVTVSLGVTEGIETGLAVIGSGWAPVWAALDAGNLGALPVLRPLVLTVFADQDAAGAKAAERLAARWRDNGLAASWVAPACPGADWNMVAS